MHYYVLTLLKVFTDVFLSCYHILVCATISHFFSIHSDILTYVESALSDFSFFFLS